MYVSAVRLEKLIRLSVDGIFFLDNALCPRFLSIGNGVQAQEKWLTVSLPFVLDTTTTVPLSSQFLPSNLLLSNAVGFVYCCSPSASSFDIPSSAKASHSVFFQLIDTFALEIGELKKEMVQTSPTVDKELMDLQGWDCFPHCFSFVLFCFFALFPPFFSYSFSKLSTWLILFCFYIPDNI